MRRTLVGAVALAVLVAGCSPTGQDRPGGPAPVPTTPAATTPTGDGTDPSPAELPPVGSVEVARTVATGLEAPWGIAFSPDGEALVTLRDAGRVVRVAADGTVTPLRAPGPDGVVPDVHHEGEGGLLGIATDGEGWVYLYLTTERDNRVVRMRLAGDALTDPQVVLEGIPADRTHNGGRLAFGPDGYLYVTTGDAREPSAAQDTGSLAGKILRLTSTGEPAPGNPFGNEVYSYGHRNVQGIAWTTDGVMVASEFGQATFDELNVVEAGANYGWPEVEGYLGEPGSGYTDPVVTWGTDEASPSGIAVTDHGVWLAALRGERLWHVPLDGGVPGEPTAHLDLGRLRAVTTTPDGELWVLTNNTDGRGEAREGDDRIVAVHVG